MDEGVSEKYMIETMRQEKTSSDISMLRNLITQTDKKIGEEQSNRIASVDEIRLYFEQKFGITNERITYGETNGLEREKRLMTHFQQSVQSIHEIATTLKDNCQNQIMDLGQQLSENYTEVTSSMNQQKSQFDLRINLVEQNIEEVMQRSETVQEMGLKHARVTNETMNKEINRLEKIVATLEDYQ